MRTPETAPEAPRPFEKRATAPVDTDGEPIPVTLPTLPSAVEQVSAGVKRAEELCRDGQGALAIRALYGATVHALSAADRIALTQTMTAREIFSKMVSLFLNSGLRCVHSPVSMN